MEPMEQKSQRSKPYIALITIIALAAGFFGGQLWTKRNNSIMDAEGFELLQATYNRINDKYLYGAKQEELINGAIVGMVESLGDQYSQFLPDEQGEQYVDSYQSNFYGIGAEIKVVNDRYFISSLVKDMPAEQAGLKPDDEIVTVDQQSVSGLSMNELLSKVRGEKGTRVVIGVKRAGTEQIIEFEIERAEIPVYSVQSERLEGDIGLISISRFVKETDTEFQEALDQLQSEGELKGIILDLRSNPGGLLDETIRIANLLIPKDKKILDVVYKNESRVVSFVSQQKEPFELPIVVLINEYSASASEVLSAALKESAGASVVGVTSYGKGVVQTYEAFREGSVLVLTEAEWKTPSGNGIHEVGVEPTHLVELPEYSKFTMISAGAELKRGSYGDDVKLLEQYLKVLGYTPSEEGLFDEQTEQALKQYERDKGLTADGVYNTEVGAALVEDIRELLARNDTQLKKAQELLNEQ
ncbi:S41 family peptidase [Paenibacillus septentrionalis]|uniref:S41 family peptidase n=1 Tax=Paenibacillus septentrionalis TaxID=429342 RepID=A0ABW1V2P3_9BACL